MTEDTYNKPIPEPTLDSQPYWDGLKAHRLLLQKCGECGKIRHYPRPVCDNCFSMDVEWIEATGKGKVHSWTETHHPFHPGFKGDVPYILVTVDLDEGVRMISQLKGATLEDLEIGMPVEVYFEDATENLTLPMFRTLK